jgi:hypothetical protein
MVKSIVEAAHSLDASIRRHNASVRNKFRAKQEAEMDRVKFERLLSYNPDKIMASCLRDLIFDMYLMKTDGDPEQANKLTKRYTDGLFKMASRKTGEKK